MPTLYNNINLTHLGNANQELKKIAAFQSNRIWGVAYAGEIKFSTTVPESYGRLENDSYLITINTLFMKEDLVFMLHHLVFEELFFWWGNRNNIKYSIPDFCREIKKFNIYSHENVYVYNGKAYTGLALPVEWEPKIGLIHMVSEYEMQKSNYL